MCFTLRSNSLAGGLAMAMAPRNFVSELHKLGVDELRRKWGWFVALGILLVILGTVAIGASVLTTLVSVVFIGWLMIVGGAMETVHAFSCKAWGGFFIDLLAGILYTVAGFLIVSNPGASAIMLTLMIAMLLIFEGVFRLVVAIAVRFHNSMWLIFHAVIDLLLGFSIWQSWPLSGLWVIGLFVGIDMIVNGWTLFMLGLTAKNLPAAEATA